jgi:stage III sporulation protein AH
MKNRVRWSLVGLLMIIICILLGLGWAFTDRLPKSFHEKDTLAVNGTMDNNVMDNQNIQVSTEVVKTELKGENYFVDYRLRRDQVRTEEKNMLAAVLNTNIEKTKEEAQQKWLELTSRIQKEDEIENLLKIKGFQDAVVDLSSDSVHIIVLAPSLSPQEVAAIQDITLRIAPVRLDRINISIRK